MTTDSPVSQSAHRRRDALVRQEGGDWTTRLRWAARQQPPPEPSDALRAEVERWRTAVDPAGRGSFEERLRRDQLDDDRALVAVSPSAAAAELEPAWWPWYRQIVADYSGELAAVGSDEDWLRAMARRLPRGTDRRIPFAHVLWPVVDGAWRRLADEDALNAIEVRDSVRDDLCRGLLARLSEFASPCLSALMWETVPYGQRLLAGIGAEVDDVPRNRYSAFCRAQVEDSLTAVLTRFPVLGGLLARIVGQWTGSVTELLVRVADDRVALADRFGIPAGAPLTHVDGAVGDTHNDGRSVAILEFDDVRRLVYKPRTVALEEVYQHLVEAVSELTPDEPLRAAVTLACTDAGGGDYGYVEYVEARPCQTDRELHAFYRNAGRILALLHALAATDCHLENLIAVGPQLVLVDAETLFDVPEPTAARLTAAVDLDVAGADPVSVLRVGMLPTWLWLEGRQLALDISALGAAAGSGRVMSGGWRHINSDAMVRGGGDGRAPHPRSLPTVAGVEGQLDVQVDTVVSGFEDTYRLLATQLAGWLLALRDASGTVKRRIVTRPTYVYAGLLASSVAPTALSSCAARACVLERLTRAYLGADALPNWSLVAAEQDALTRLDVPYFQVPLRGGRTDWLGGRLEGSPDDEAWTRVESRVAGLGEADLRWQTSLIRASVAASNYRMVAEPEGQQTQPQVTASDSRPQGHACLAAVAEAGIAVGGDRTWMGLSLLPDGVRANVQSIGSGLYDGRMGLAVALYEGSAVQAAQVDLSRVADDALAPLLRLLTSGDQAELVRLTLAVGPGMGGVGGQLRGLGFLRERGRGDPSQLAAAEGALLRVLSPQWLADDRRLDHISGVAGMIAPLARLLTANRLSCLAGHVESLLRSAAEVLVARQDRDTGGWSTLPATAPLTGLAHGAAGIALALAEAGVALGEPGYLDAAMTGLEYEAGAFDQAARNWPDFRVSGRSGGFMMGWCAGAPGTALTRLRLLQLLPDSPQAPAWRDELVMAADTTAAARLSARDHLCCGNLGRVAVLRTLSSLAPPPLSHPHWEAAANGIEAAVLARPGEPLPRSILGPMLSGIPMPGLFTGLSGAGLVLLDIEPATWVPQLLL